MENSERHGNTKPPDPPLEKLICRSGSNSLTGSGTKDWFKFRKEYLKAVYCHPAYLIYMQSTLCEMSDWMKHKLESRLQGEISITSDQ